MLRAVATVIVLVGLCAGVRAATEADRRDCASHSNAETRIAACTRIIEDKASAPPVLALAYRNRGTTYGNKGLHELANFDFNEALKLSPDDQISLHGRGRSFAQMGQYDRAIADLSRYLKLNPGNDRAFNERGLAHLRKNDLDLALADFDSAIKINPLQVVARNNRAFAARATGQDRGRHRGILRGDPPRPSYRLAYSNRGDAYEASGQYDKALADYKFAERRPAAAGHGGKPARSRPRPKSDLRGSDPDRRRQGYAESHGGGRAPRRARHCQQRLRARRRRCAIPPTTARRWPPRCAGSAFEVREALRRQSFRVRQSAQGLRRPGGRRRLGRDLFCRPRHGDRRHQLPHSGRCQAGAAAPCRGRGDAAGARAGQGCGRQQDAARHPRCLPQQPVRRQDAPIRPGDALDRHAGSLRSSRKAACSSPMRHATARRRSTARATARSWRRSSKHIGEPGLEINLLFRKVRDEVLTKTSRQQEPFTYGSLPAQPFFFRR